MASEATPLTLALRPLPLCATPVPLRSHIGMQDPNHKLMRENCGVCAAEREAWRVATAVSLARSNRGCCTFKR